MRRPRRSRWRPDLFGREDRLPSPVATRSPLCAAAGSTPADGGAHVREAQTAGSAPPPIMIDGPQPAGRCRRSMSPMPPCGPPHAPWAPASIGPASFNASGAVASTNPPRYGQQSGIAPPLPGDAWPCPGCAPPGRGVPGLPSVQPQNLSTSHPYWSLFTTKPVQIEMHATNCRRSCTRLSNARCLQRCPRHPVVLCLDQQPVPSGHSSCLLAAMPLRIGHAPGLTG